MKKSIFSTMALLLATVAGCSSTPASTGACATVTCSMNQFCDAASGACKTASACTGVSCGAGTVCDGTDGSATAGMCVAETCGATQCTGGQVCNQATLTCVKPGVPALSSLIDRMGRPAVNTALSNPFDVYPLPVGQGESSDITKNRYNHDGNAAGWVAAWTPAISLNLALLDGLDNVCTNQFAYNTPAGTNYGTLAGVLADDRLLVNTTKTTCTQYLGVETQSATDCGGRTLSEDVIDVTYSAIGIGALTGVSDGIAQTNVPTANFPFFKP